MLHQPRGVNIKKSNFFEVGFAVGQDGDRKASQGKSGFSHYVSQLQEAPHSFSKHAKCFPVNFQPKTFCFDVSVFARVGGDHMK